MFAILTTLTLVTVCLVVVTVLPMTRITHWFVRDMDFPRFQIAVVAIVLMVAQSVVLDAHHPLRWLLAGVTLICLAVQLWWILPYTRLWKKEVKTASESDPSQQLTILTSNVLTPNRNAEALIDLVHTHKPDIVVTLESDQWWQDQLAVLETELAYSVKCPLDNLYGMHLYSRLPFDEEEVAFLVEDDVPSIHLRLQLRTGDNVRMHFIHPAPPSPTENTSSSERDSELVIVAKSVAETTEPVVVTGDLNDVAWSATTRLFRKISGLLDPRIGRGMFNTFHADYFFLRWPLDHLFHSDHFTLKSIQRLPSIGSDHFPLLTTLVFTPINGADQVGLACEADDKALAEAIADDQQVEKHDVPLH
jgi:endonuclease/exonuclease/phosphatase (EEP) superfamily protein YafD